MTDRDESPRLGLARTLGSSTAPHLSNETFLGLRDAIADVSGIVFDERSRFIIERRLLSRLRALRLDDFETYYRLLLYGPESGAEMTRLLEAVTIRETYFYREAQQLEAFRDELLPRLAVENASRQELRIWSAGCATGEEPYTIAILVHETGLFDGWRIEIIGTDLVPQAIAAAERGLYRDASMRAVSEDSRGRYFIRDGDNAWRLRPDFVRTTVSFRLLNLIQTETYAELNPFDVIFCRNVLIYFSPETRRRIALGFYERLRPGGYLLLGHAESLVSFSTPFDLCHLRRDMVYRR